MSGARHYIRAEGAATAFDWSEDAIAKLREMHAAGLSCSFMGDVLGVSRNAVIGKIHRMGLNGKVYVPGPRAERPKVKVAAPKHRPPPKPRPIAPRRLIVQPIPIPPPEPMPTANAWEPLPGTVPVALVDLDRGMCKWPVSEGRPFLFCGCKAAEGSNYCATHYARSLGSGTPSERQALSAAKAAAKLDRVLT